ncbi:MAG: hypothetical protein JEZ06_05935 [Anaerolineaceae bacterium]|nr:hypothetical protein [Anaerolineaceae bacterium]
MSNSPRGTRFCPYCNSRISSDTSICHYCGYHIPLFSQTRTAEQNHIKQKKNTKNKVIIPVLVSGIVLCVISLICGLGGAYFYRDQLMNLIQPQQDGRLILDPRSTDGSVSGEYIYPKDKGDISVRFTVSEEGFATFYLDGAPESEKLAVSLSDENTSSIQWGNTIFDGIGPLSEDEQSSLNNLMNNDLAYSLALIPLDIACQGEEIIDAKQVATLLIPMQMRFKYLVADREAEAQQLLAVSKCEYGLETKDENVEASFIQFSSSMPVPVVFGYFPFDDQGAVETTLSLLPESEVACLGTLSLKSPTVILDSNYLADNPESNIGNKVNEYGACGSKCRGACGMDCTLNNCERTTELRCEKNEAGKNTGQEMRFLVFTCGTHKGCIDHDACYDNCNDFYNCGTWSAAVCRHGELGIIPEQYVEIGFCDQKAIDTYGYTEAINWARGYGTHSGSEIFEYTDEAYGKHLEIEKCPSEEVVFSISPEEVTEGELHDTHQFLIQAVGFTKFTKTIRLDWNFGDVGNLDYPAKGTKTIDVSDSSVDLTIVHRYEEAGEYTLEVSLYDDTFSGNILLGMLFVDVEILPDEFRVNIEPSNPTGTVGEPVLFTADVNNPGSYVFDWKFNDIPKKDFGQKVSFSFDDLSGEFPVKVDVYDQNGMLLGNDDVSVLIYPSPTPTVEEQKGVESGPSATLTELSIVPQSPYIDTDVQFWVDGENWPSNPAFDWDFGEPFFETNGKRGYQVWTNMPEAIWNYSESGTFQVTVVIRDNENYSVILDKRSWWITVQGKEED